MGEGTRARGGGSKGFGSGGVGGRGTAPELAWCTGRPDAPTPQVWGSGGLQGLRCRGGRTEQIPATCVVFLTFLSTFRRKMAFFEGCPVGWGRVQGGAERGPRALVPGG